MSSVGKRLASPEQPARGLCGRVDLIATSDGLAMVWPARGRVCRIGPGQAVADTKLREGGIG